MTQSDGALPRRRTPADPHFLFRDDRSCGRSISAPRTSEPIATPAFRRRDSTASLTTCARSWQHLASEILRNQGKST